jgi:hypothetical protein
MKTLKPEASFQTTVLALLQLHGWRVAHFRKARTGKGGWITPVAADGKGFPDLLAIKGEHIIVAELKVPPNGLTKEQEDWLSAFGNTAVPWFLWTPADWDDITAVVQYPSRYLP